MADFNARLTTFEAGINSKIDSQVSSYLDRNGIWNKKRQALTSDAYKGKLTFFDNWCIPAQETQANAKVLTASARAITTSDSRSIKIVEGSAWRFPDNNGYRKGQSFVVIDEISKSGLLMGTVDCGTWCGYSGGGLTPNYDHEKHYFGKFLKDANTWTNESQAKPLSNYPSTNQYANTLPISAAWYNADTVTMSSALYIESSVDDFANTCWVQMVQELKYTHNAWDAEKNRPATRVYANVDNGYYDQIDVNLGPKQYVYQTFVSKGQRLQARWAWKILGNTFHLANGQAAYLLFKPPNENQGTAEILDKKIFAQLIQFTDLGVY